MFLSHFPSLRAVNSSPLPFPSASAVSPLPTFQACQQCSFPFSYPSELSTVLSSHSPQLREFPPSYLSGLSTMFLSLFPSSDLSTILPSHSHSFGSFPPLYLSGLSTVFVSLFPSHRAVNNFSLPFSQTCQLAVPLFSPHPSELGLMFYIFFFIPNSQSCQQFSILPSHPSELPIAPPPSPPPTCLPNSSELQLFPHSYLSGLSVVFISPFPFFRAVDRFPFFFPFLLSFLSLKAVNSFSLPLPIC